MRKLTAEERAAKKAGLPQVAEVAVESKKKAKKAKAEPQGISSDSFVIAPAEKVEEVAEVAAEEVAEEIVTSDSDAAAE